ncbi:MAG: Membrane-associated phospholipid phosphatase PgpB [Candidatus Methanohalarchaeum thermophilum]|uniref:Membrane-associated phospholipid phosphatase PgpB n=1 Tax=Methanohalarchaeum thermophilum TaxID=1903181 RepID=A0A1Q6DSE9_METT1|nr:MAG: Membrane-associated phospholipid phosphatase PgpB [Candidatus Methanohalarchaeum thermophilum]
MELPSLLKFLAGLVTQLGDIGFIILFLVFFYLLDGKRFSLTDNRSKSFFYLSTIFVVSVVLTFFLKNLFRLPRPPSASAEVAPIWMKGWIEEIYISMTTGSGYGFPSGHSLISTSFYLGLAHVVKKGTRKVRFSLALLIVTVVCLTRILLGVHYLLDVAVGFLIGLFLFFAITLLIKPAE